MKTLSSELADYASSIRFPDLPSRVIHEVKRRLMDSLGCAMGAYDSAPGKIARQMARDLEIGVKGTYCSTILGTEDKTSPELATFINGTFIRYLDYNDTYLSKEPAHPSDNISAALAVAEAEKRDGKDLITSIVLGYEIHCRLCDAASLRSRGWDHVAYVSIASAIVASRLMYLDPDKIKNAISLSITPNIPLRQTRVGELSMWKGCAAANAARNGVFAAILSRQGMTGPPLVFEGEKGFFNQVTGPFELNVDSFGGRKGHFKILDTYIKFYPSEYHSQAAVEASLDLLKDLDINEIEEINVETYDACVDIIAGDTSKWNPATRETADHSLPYCIASALYYGRLGLDEFSEDKLKDPGLRRLISKVKVKRNPDHTRAYPDAFPCLIGIRTRSGETYSKTVSYPKGHPENPMTDGEMEEKFRTLSGGLINDKKVKEIVRRIWNLEELRHVEELMALLVIGG